MNTLAKAGVAVLALSIAFGCSTTTSPEPVATPTHRWVAEMDVSRAKYNFDNARCVDQAQVDVGTTPKSEPAFIAYEHCMRERGYNLSTYTPTRYPGGH